MSGHSKWAQIKHKKAASDAKKSQIFSKMVREITVAARSGGTNLETNARLRAAIDHARAIGLPKENVERAVRRASGKGVGEGLQEFIYETAVPPTISIIIEGITDNKNRTLAELKRILADHGAKLADPGSVIWNFDKIGVIVISAAENTQKTKEGLELAIIDAGALDFTKQEDVWIVETEYTGREKVKQTMEKQGIVIKEVGHDYKSRSPLEVSPETKERISILLEELSDHDDVQEVYTNIKFL